jgi:Ion transport protein
MLMLIIVLVNSIIVIIGFIDSNEARGELYDTIDYWFIVVYILEFIIKIIGLGIFGYFRDNWNKLDFVLIIISLSTDFAFTMLRVLRNARAAKASRITRLVRAKKAYRMVRSIRSFRVALNDPVLPRPQKSVQLHPEAAQERAKVHPSDSVVPEPDHPNDHAARHDLPHLRSDRHDDFQHRLQYLLHRPQAVRDQ